MLNNKELNEIIFILNDGNDFSEIYYEKKYSNIINMENNKIVKIDTGTEEGIGFRIINGLKTTYGYTNNLLFSNLKRIAKELNKKSKYNSFSDKEKTKLIKAKSSSEIDYKNVEMKEKIKILNLAYEYCKSLTKENIKQNSLLFSDATKEITIFNSEKKYVFEKINKGVFRNQVILEKNGEIQTGFSSFATSNGFETFTKEKIFKVCEESYEAAELLFSAKSFPSGEMDVIMAGTAGGTMIHEACGHGLELDLVQENLSIFKNKLNKKVASSKVTVIDDGTISSLFGTRYFDDEGNKNKETILIKDGILKCYLNSKLTAKKSNISDLTSNARRESYKNIPIVRMQNTYIKSGSDSRSKMISEIKKGIIVYKMGGGQVDTVTGNFIFSALKASYIENGKILFPIKNVCLQGNGKDVLKNIESVSNDLEFTPGLCGKDGQSVAVTCGQPSIKIKGLLVGGEG